LYGIIFIRRKNLNTLWVPYKPVRWHQTKLLSVRYIRQVLRFWLTISMVFFIRFPSQSEKHPPVRITTTTVAVSRFYINIVDSW